MQSSSHHNCPRPLPERLPVTRPSGTAGPSSSRPSSRAVIQARVQQVLEETRTRSYTSLKVDYRGTPPGKPLDQRVIDILFGPDNKPEEGASQARLNNQEEFEGPTGTETTTSSVEESLTTTSSDEQKVAGDSPVFCKVADGVDK
jgi:hypothetical protein